MSPRLLDEVLLADGLLITLRTAATPGAVAGLPRTVARDSQQGEERIQCTGVSSWPT